MSDFLGTLLTILLYEALLIVSDLDRDRPTSIWTVLLGIPLLVIIVIAIMTLPFVFGRWMGGQ